MKKRDHIYLFVTRQAFIRFFQSFLLFYPYFEIKIYVLFTPTSRWKTWDMRFATKWSFRHFVLKAELVFTLK